MRVVLVIFLAGVFAAINCKPESDEPLILDVRSVMNESLSEVEEILGKPDSSYILQMMGKSIPCQLYQTGYKIEIQFPDSLATDIVVYGARGLPFDQTALSAFNLDYRKKHPSDYRKGSYIRWADFYGLSAISFYNPRKDSLGNITQFDIYFKVGRSR